MMLGAEDGCWYSDQHFSVAENKIVSNWSGKVVGFLVGTKPDINYLCLFTNDKSNGVNFGDNTVAIAKGMVQIKAQKFHTGGYVAVTNLKLPDSPTLWQKFLNFWRM